MIRKIYFKRRSLNVNLKLLNGRRQMKRPELLISFIAVFCFNFLMPNSVFALGSQDAITVQIPQQDYEVLTTAEGHEISVENYGRLLPSRIFAVAIPPGVEVGEISFETGEPIKLPGVYSIPPVPLPRVIGQEDPLIYAEEKLTVSLPFPCRES
jgi:hypothetical protein